MISLFKPNDEKKNFYLHLNFTLKRFLTNLNIFFITFSKQNKIDSKTYFAT